MVRMVVGLGAFLLVLALDIVASLRVGRWAVVTPAQKAAWLAFIWFVPLLGSVLALQTTAEAVGGPPRGQSSGVGIGDPVGLDVGGHGGGGFDGGGHGGDGGGH